MSQSKPRFDKPSMESLEPRLLLSITTPLAIGGITLGTFIDSDGDVVSVSIAGTAGSVAFTDTTPAAGVANTKDIATVTITGASSDFQITFSDDDSGADGGGTILLGDITSTKAINAILTVGGSAGVSHFTLGSYIGSLSANAKIQVYDIAGNAGGVGLQLPSLANGQVINVGNDLNGDVIINGNYAGAINVGDDWTGDVTVHGSVTSTGRIGAVTHDMDGVVQIDGNFSGIATAGGAADGVWTINGSLTLGGVLTASGWDDLTIGRVSGKIIANDDDIVLEVIGSVGGKASIIADEDIDITVHGNVASGANIDATDGDLDALVDGSASGTWRAGGGTLDFEAGNIVGGAYFGDITIVSHGGISNATIGGSDVSITASRAITNTSIVASSPLAVTAPSLSKVKVAADVGAAFTIAGNATSFHVAGGADIVLNIGGNLSSSTVTASGDLIGFVDGKVIRSSLTADGDVGTSLAGPAPAAEFGGAITFEDSIPAFIVGRGVIGSNIISSGDMTFEVMSGGVTNSTIAGGGYTVMELVGNILNGTLVGADFLDLTVMGNFLSGKAGGTGPDFDELGVDISVSGNVGRNVIFEAAGDSNLLVDVGGNFGGQATTGNNADIEVDGSVLQGAVLYSDEDLILEVGRDFNGKIDTTDLDLWVHGKVLSKGIIQAANVEDLDTDDLGFIVDGDFAGKLDVAGNFTTGDGGSEDVFGGDVLRTGHIIINGDLGGADNMNVLGDFLGRLELGSLNGVDLSFGGNANNITIQNQVDADIDVGGFAKHFRTGSFFSPIDAFDGKFVSGDDTSSTGSLTTGTGYSDITPLALV